MSHKFPRGQIVIFAKQPVPGRVKTRLVPRVGAKAAAELARAGLTDTYRVAREFAPVVLAWDGLPGAVPSLSPAPQVRSQSAGDLGQRMGSAFAAGFESNAAWVVALGTDSPGFPPNALGRACEALEQAPTPHCVLGPSNDGGYYLIGLSSWQYSLLDELPWSAPTTCSATRSRVTSRGFTCEEVEEYFDVDDADDLDLLLSLHAQSALDAPATTRWIERWFSGSHA